MAQKAQRGGSKLSNDLSAASGFITRVCVRAVDFARVIPMLWYQVYLPHAAPDALLETLHALTRAARFSVAGARGVCHVAGGRDGVHVELGSDHSSLLCQ